MQDHHIAGILLAASASLLWIALEIHRDSLHRKRLDKMARIAKAKAESPFTIAGGTVLPVELM